MVSVEGLNARNWDEIKPIYQEFLDRPINSAVELESWLLELGRFDAYVGETGSMLYVGMTCDTENEEVKQAYLDFVEQVQPELAKVGDLLNRKLAESPFADDLDTVEYNVLLRDTRMDLQLFREENIPLGTELTKLGQRYNEICGAMTVDFEGEERTIQQMVKFLQVNDRDVRERAYRLVGERRFQDSEEIYICLHTEKAGVYTQSFWLMKWVYIQPLMKNLENLMWGSKFLMLKIQTKDTSRTL